jgi:hypothetical protein
MHVLNPSESVINIIWYIIRNSHGASIAAFASFRTSLQVVDPCRRVNIIYHAMDELLTKQQVASDGHAASLVKERA